MKAQVAFVGPHKVGAGEAEIVQLQVQPGAAQAAGLEPGAWIEIFPTSASAEDPTTFWPAPAADPGT